MAAGCRPVRPLVAVTRGPGVPKRPTRSSAPPPPTPAGSPRPGRPARGGIAACAALTAQRADGAGAMAAAGVSRVRRIPPWPGPACARGAGRAGNGRECGRCGAWSAAAVGTRVACRARGAGKARRGASTRFPHRPLRRAPPQHRRRCKARAVLRAGAAWALCGTSRDALRSAGSWRDPARGLHGASCGPDQAGLGQPVNRYAIGTSAQAGLGGVSTGL
jgi:hypothetical protein